MSKRRVYVDANILIAAYRGRAEIAESALKILEDPGTDLIVSDPLWLEIMPKPRFFKRKDETDFFEAIFSCSAQHVGWSSELTTLAENLAIRYGLAAMDALHVAAAILADADELVTGERSTKPMLNVTEIKVRSLQPS